MERGSPARHLDLASLISSPVRVHVREGGREGMREGGREGGREGATVMVFLNLEFFNFRLRILTYLHGHLCT